MGGDASAGEGVGGGAGWAADGCYAPSERELRVRETVDRLGSYLWLVLVAGLVIWCVFGTLLRPDLDPGSLLEFVFTAVFAWGGQWLTKGGGLLLGVLLIVAYGVLWLVWQLVEPFWTCAAGLALVVCLLGLMAVPAVLANLGVARMPRRFRGATCVSLLLLSCALTAESISQRPGGWRGQLYWRHTLLEDLCAAHPCRDTGLLGPGEGVDLTLVKIPLKAFAGPDNVREPTLWLEPQLFFIRHVDAAITYRVAGDLTISGEQAVMVAFEGVEKAVLALLECALLYAVVWSVLMCLCTWANPYLLLTVGLGHACWRTFSEP